MTALPQSTIEGLERVRGRGPLPRRKVLLDRQWHVLPRYRGQVQEQENWCWAAVCASIQDYYRKPTEPALRQCTVVNTQFPHDCCRNAASPLCDRQGSLGRALTDTHQPHRIIEGPIGFHPITAQIDRGNPVVARVEPHPGNFHFVVIFGYASGLRLLVWDPEPGEGVRQTNMNDWRQDFGRWLQTYLRR